MEILQLDGLEPQLFNLIGPLAMNPKVLRANNNYPFKTTERFQWYIAVEDNDVTGFVPVEQKSGGYVINNYYVQLFKPNTKLFFPTVVFKPNTVGLIILK